MDYVRPPCVTPKLKESVYTSKSILNYINKFKHQPSIKVIKSRKKEEQTFTFSYASYEEVLNEIRKLKTKKITQQNDIPTKIQKKNSEVFAGYFQKKHKFSY